MWRAAFAIFLMVLGKGALRKKVQNNEYSSPRLYNEYGLFIWGLRTSLITNIFFNRQWRRHHSAVVIDNNIILIGDLNQTGIGAATGEFVRSGTKPGTWSGEQFDLKNNGLWTCAVSYQGGFVTIGSVVHRKVDRSRHLTIPCRNSSLCQVQLWRQIPQPSTWPSTNKSSHLSPARHSHLQMEKRFFGSFLFIGASRADYNITLSGPSWLHSLCFWQWFHKTGLDGCRRFGRSWWSIKHRGVSAVNKTVDKIGWSPSKARQGKFKIYLLGIAPPIWLMPKIEGVFFKNSSLLSGIHLKNK